jgi:MFS family permease
VYGLIEAPTVGWGDPHAWGSVAAGIAALAAFVAVERRVRHPMVPLELFGNRTFTAANLLTLFLYGALAGLFFFLPFDLIQSRGYSPAAAGAAILPMVILVSAFSRWSGALADRFGPRLFLTIGPLIAGAGVLLLAVLPTDSSYAASVLPGLSVLGLGMAITVAPLTAAVLNAVDKDDQGSASGINNAVARVAALLAIAVFGIVVAATFHRSLDDELDAARVSSSVRRLLEPELDKLGAMKPPKGVPAAEARTIERAVGASLHRSFRYVCWICAALGVLASGCAAWGVRKNSPGPG